MSDELSELEEAKTIEIINQAEMLVDFNNSKIKLMEFIIKYSNEENFKDLEKMQKIIKAVELFLKNIEEIESA